MLPLKRPPALRRHLAEQYNENNNDDPDAFDESRAAADDADPAAVAAVEGWSIFDDNTLWTVKGDATAVDVTIVADDPDVAWALRVLVTFGGEALKAAMADELDTEEVVFANADFAEAPDPATVFEDDVRGGTLAAMIVAVANHNGDFAEEMFERFEEGLAWLLEPAPPAKRPRKT